MSVPGPPGKKREEPIKSESTIVSELANDVSQKTRASYRPREHQVSRARPGEISRAVDPPGHSTSAIDHALQLGIFVKQRDQPLKSFERPRSTSRSHQLDQLIARSRLLDLIRDRSRVVNLVIIDH
jgi:hypothetical protein